MRIILARHAKAEEGGGKADEERRLVDEGREQAKLLGKFLARTMDKVDEVWTSPYPRARETAEIAAVPLLTKVTEEPELRIGGDLEQVGWKLAQVGKGTVMLTGHQPDLGMLAARLLGIRSPVTLKKTGICVIDTPNPAKGVGRAVATLKPSSYPEILEGREYAPWMIRKQLI